MLFWKREKPGNEWAMDWRKHVRVPGQGIVVRTGHLEACAQGPGFFIPTPIHGCDRSNLQEDNNHA